MSERLPKSRGQRSQYVRVGPAVLTLLFEDRIFDKKNRENEGKSPGHIDNIDLPDHIK